jgi:hypothetical protein
MNKYIAVGLFGLVLSIVFTYLLWLAPDLIKDGDVNLAF